MMERDVISGDEVSALEGEEVRPGGQGLRRADTVVIMAADDREGEEARRLLSLRGYAVLGVARGPGGLLSLLRETAPDAVVIVARGLAPRAEQAALLTAALRPGAALVALAGKEMRDRLQMAGARAVVEQPDEALARAVAEAVAWRRREEEARRVAPEALAQTVVVFSARGGQGKTTVATGLAETLARWGESVCYYDLDPYGTGPRLLEGTKVVVERGSAARIDEAARRSEWTVVDTRAGLGEEALQALERADLALLVTTPEPAALREQMRALSDLRRMEYPQEALLLAVDRPSARLSYPLREVEEALGLQAVVDVPYDRRVEDATRAGKVVTAHSPSSRAARAIVRLAARLAGVSAAVDGDRGRSGLARLVASLKGRDS